MTDALKKPIKTLCPLPGGNGHYLSFVTELLEYLSSSQELSRREVLKWITSQYNVKPNTASEVMRMIGRLALIQVDGTGKIGLSELGSEFLREGGEGQIRLLADLLMQYGVAMPQVLGAFSNSRAPVHLTEIVDALSPQFPDWTSDMQFKQRVLWLLSLQFVEQVEGRTYRITSLGREYAIRYPSSFDPRQQFLVEQTTHGGDPSLGDHINHLIEELTAAAYDTSNPHLLEALLAEAFKFLGFSVQLYGEPGNTDIVATAEIGPDSYSIIIDAKSRQSGRLETLEGYTLQQHRKKSGADHILVVAWSFSGGKIIRQAEDEGVVLLSIPVLTAWLHAHAQMPLNLRYYRHIFDRTGLLGDLPPAIKDAFAQQRRQTQLIVDLVDLVGETYQHGLKRPLNSNELSSMLVIRQRRVNYETDEVQSMLDLLRHPLIRAAFGNDQEGTSLAVNRATLARIFRALALQIEHTAAQI